MSLQPILASVDCHDCTARSGEFHDDGCATYALYESGAAAFRATQEQETQK